jgi:hypothetical protein
MVPVFIQHVPGLQPLLLYINNCLAVSLLFVTADAPNPEDERARGRGGGGGGVGMDQFAVS